MNIKDRIQAAEDLLPDDRKITIGEGMELCEITGGELLRSINAAYMLGALTGYELRDAQSLEEAFPAQYDAVESQEINAMRDFLSGRGFKLNDFDLIATIAAIYRAGKGVKA